MTPLLKEELDRIRQRYRRSGAISAVGVLFVLVAMALGVWQTSGLQRQAAALRDSVTTEQQQLAKAQQAGQAAWARFLADSQHFDATRVRIQAEESRLRAERRGLLDALAGLQGQVHDLEGARQRLTVANDTLSHKVDTLGTRLSWTRRQWFRLQRDSTMHLRAIDSLAAQRQQFQDSLRSIYQETEKRGGSRLNPLTYLFGRRVSPGAIRSRIPLSATVVPHASASPAATDTAGRQVLEFALWLEVPQDRRAEIRSVTYSFRHPELSQPALDSSDPTRGYRVGFRGPQCLGVVVITLNAVDGSPQPLSFDMCKALE